MSSDHTPNETRGIVKNPNNPQHEADLANRRKLGHPGVPPAAPSSPAAPTPSPQPAKK